jgi:hypothetical protein
MSKMTDGVEETFDRRMEDIHSKAQMASDRIDLLSTQLDRLMIGIDDAEGLISIHLAEALKVSAYTIT